jgi:hypothetical protein
VHHPACRYGGGVGGPDLERDVGVALDRDEARANRVHRDPTRSELARDRKTGEMVTIDNQNEVIDAGDEGVAYAFRPFQKVHRMHPAVLASPGTFIPLDEVDTDIHPIVEAF